MVEYPGYPSFRFYYHPDPSNDKFEAHQVVSCFFQDFNLEQAKDLLWLLFRGAAENTDTLENGRLPDLIFLFEKLHDLILASYIIEKKPYV